MHRHDRHEGKRGGVHAVQECAGEPGPAQARQEWDAERNEDEGGKEDSHGCHGRAGGAAEQVADERRCGEERTGDHLPNGDRVEELLFGQPAVPADEVGAEEGEQDVAAAVKHRADLQEDQEERPEAERDSPGSTTATGMAGVVGGRAVRVHATRRRHPLQDGHGEPDPEQHHEFVNPKYRKRYRHDRRDRRQRRADQTRPSRQSACTTTAMTTGLMQ